MILNYYTKPARSRATLKEHKRLVAVSAALEIARASCSSSSNYYGMTQTKADLLYVSAGIAQLADAIQDALESENEEE